MNLKVLQWLIAHRDLLMKVVAVVKKYSKDATLLEKWVLVDEVARLIIPVVQDNDEVLGLLTRDYIDWEDDSEVSFALGADVAALGVDWRLIIELVLPVVISILEALACKK